MLITVLIVSQKVIVGIPGDLQHKGVALTALGHSVIRSSAWGVGQGQR